MTAVRKLAAIAAKPGAAAALRAALVRLEEATRAEPGCREFRFYQALGDLERFVLVEEFADEAALAVHMRLPHTRAFFELGLTAAIAAEDLPVSG